MVTIPYYEVFEPTEEEINNLNAAGSQSYKAGYRFHDGNWYRRIGMTGASDGAAGESRNRPLTFEEIQNWQTG